MFLFLEYERQLEGITYRSFFGFRKEKVHDDELNGTPDDEDDIGMPADFG